MTIDTILTQLNSKYALNNEVGYNLELLFESAKYKEYQFKLELFKKIDRHSKERLPVSKLLDIFSIVGAFPTSMSSPGLTDDITAAIAPYIEVSSKKAKQIIPKLLSNSLLLFLKHNEMPVNAITRQYIFTDQLEIYKLEFKICCFKMQCPYLREIVDTIYCITGSKTIVNTDYIDFLPISHFYQHQLLAYGIDRHRLIYLYQEMKDTYFRHKQRHSPISFH